jgi:hypothetical protein
VASADCDIQRRPTGTPSREQRQVIHEIAYALVPFFFSMAMGYLAGKLTRGAMPLSSINTMLVVYALPSDQKNPILGGDAAKLLKI